VKKIFIAASVILLWLLTMAALIDKHYAVFSEKPSGKPHALQGFLEEERWAGIYQRGRKAGYTMSRLESKEGNYKATELAFLKIKALEVEKDIKMNTKALLDSELKLKSFTFNLESDIDMLIEGKVVDRDLLVTIDSKGIKTNQKFSLSDSPYINISLSPLLADMKLTSGETIRLPLFDPSTLAQDYLELKIKGREQITVMGTKRDTFKLRGFFEGAEIIIWVTDDGEVLREESMGFTFVRERKEDAVILEKASIDLVADMAVPFNLKIKSDINYLKVKLTAIDFEGLELDGDNQKLNDDILEIWKVEFNDKLEIHDNIEVTSHMSQYLKETIFVESRDPRISKLAEEIISQEKDPLRKSRLIFDWTYKNLKKTATISIPRSTAVLDSKEGDCNEHTTLYTALARASGIPTRMAVGLVHQEGLFYYHAWPEVYVGGWIPIDPTLGQFPADASHIRLLTGELDSQLRLAPVMGNLKIEGLEAR
jgi:hypothetical protein